MNISWNKKALRPATFLLLCVFLFSLLISACGPTYNIKSNHYKQYQNYTFKLVDQRPAKDMESKGFTINGYSCDYGVFQVAEDETTPNRIKYLKNTLQQYRSSALSTYTVYVKKFTIYRNKQGTSRDAASSAIRGNAAQSVNSTLRTNECIASANYPGGISRKENPNGYPAVVIEITLEIAGRSKNYRTVYTEVPEVDLLAMTEKDLVTPALHKAIQPILKSLSS